MLHALTQIRLNAWQLVGFHEKYHISPMAGFPGLFRYGISEDSELCTIQNPEMTQDIGMRWFP